MSVIPFPVTKHRHQVAPRRLTLDEVDALTAQDFFPCVQVDTENGTAVLQQDDASRLTQYLAFHGLRLPRVVKADEVLDLCNDLRWSFGAAVRSAARDASDMHEKFPLLNAEKMAYVRAIASQSHLQVRDLARPVFKDRARQVFLY